jgi:hypothetical protein
MSSFDPVNIPRKYPTSATVKFIVLLLVIFGIWLRSCYYRQLPKQMIISNVNISNVTSQSVDVNFTLENRKGVNMDQNLFIQLYTSENYMISSKIVKVTVPANRKLEFIKILDDMNRPLNKAETIQKATVELYTPKLF